MYFDHEQALTKLLLPINKNSHKGHFAHVMILEGHPHYLGASRLAALAALRAGASCVTILCKDAKLYHPCDLAEFMKRELISNNFKDNFSKIDSLVLGPGLSQDLNYQQEALLILKEASKHIANIILDADGLTLLTSNELTATKATFICTPHPKEAALLLGLSTKEIEKDRKRSLELLSKLAINQKINIIWVLKGSHTLLRSLRGEVFCFKGELPILGTGGSGDVLSGTIAGLIKQTATALDATLAAISLQIAAASYWSKFADRGVLPYEMTKIFPKFLKRVKKDTKK